MKVFVWNLLTFASLLQGLPIEESSKSKRCPEKWCPTIRQQVFYPTDFTEHNCPTVPGLNKPWSTYFDAPKEDIVHDEFKKRTPDPSVEKTSTSLSLLQPRQRPPNPLCHQVAANTAVNNFNAYVGNTAAVVLKSGVTYVFSWAFDTAVDLIRLWVNGENGGFHNILSETTGLSREGTWEFTMPNGPTQTGHFEVAFDQPHHFGLGFHAPQPFIDGQFALFELLPALNN